MVMLYFMRNCYLLSLMGNLKPNSFFKNVDSSWSWQLLLWRVYECTGETGETSVCWWNELFLSSAREQSFPRGMTQPHAVGCQPENSGKNRFKKLCACEYSRYNFWYSEVQFVCVLTHLCQAEVIYFAKRLSTKERRKWLLSGSVLQPSHT